jgi:hypothetical protein
MYVLHTTWLLRACMVRHDGDSTPRLCVLQQAATAWPQLRTMQHYITSWAAYDC